MVLHYAQEVFEGLKLSLIHILHLSPLHHAGDAPAGAPVGDEGGIGVGRLPPHAVVEMCIRDRTRTVELQWLPEYTTFSSIDRRHSEY